MDGYNHQKLPVETNKAFEQRVCREYEIDPKFQLKQKPSRK